MLQDIKGKRYGAVADLQNTSGAVLLCIVDGECMPEWLEGLGSHSWSENVWVLLLHFPENIARREPEHRLSFRAKVLSAHFCAPKITT